MQSNPQIPIMLLYNMFMIYWLVAGNLLMLITFFFRLSTLPPQLPLFYSRPWGEEQLGDFWFIFLIPVLVNLLVFFNEYIYKRFFLGNILAKHVFEFLNIFLTVSFTLIFIKIILLVS